MSGRGSEWARWDLHIHTPCSIQQHYGGDQPAVWERYLKALEALPKDVQALGITDYYFPDGYERIMAARETHGRLPNIRTVFPVLEFRIDTFGSASESKISKINLHILFNVDAGDWRAGSARVRREFIERLDISKHCKNKPLSRENFGHCASDGKQKTGFAELYPSTDEVLQRLRGWKDDVILFLGYKEWNDLEKGNQAKLEKQDLYNKVSGFFTASPGELLAPKRQTLAAFGDKGLLHSLDIHDFGDFDAYECRTWIKAEPTFAGLKQALAVPAERICSDTRPPKLLAIEDRPGNVIESLRIQTLSDDAQWFDQIGTIPLNPGLIAIIGNKGMGKTALADALCAACNVRDDQYSFLAKSKFLKHPTAKKYTATAQFLDGTSAHCAFTKAKFDQQKPARALYLAQTFVTKLCDDIEGAVALQDQIDRVIFSHLSDDTRGRHETLASLVTAVKQGSSFKEEKIRAAIHDCNSKIIAAEVALSGDTRVRLRLALDAVNQQLADHEAAKPPTTEAPAGAAEVKDVLNALLEKRETQLRRIAAQLKTLSADLKRWGARRESLENVRVSAGAARDSVAELVRRINADDFLTQALDPTNFIQLSVNWPSLDQAEAHVATGIENMNQRVTRLKGLQESINAQKGRVIHKLDGKRLEKAKATQAASNWIKRREDLIGNADAPVSKTGLTSQLERLEGHWPQEHARLIQERQTLCDNLWRAIAAREARLAVLYGPAQRRAEGLAKEFGIPPDDFIGFESSISPREAFSEDFLRMINKNRAGTFHGADSAIRSLQTMVQSVLEQPTLEWSNLAPLVTHALLHNEATGAPSAPRHEDWTVQLAQGITAQQVYDFLFGLEYLEAKFRINYAGKPIPLLSPGDRGLLLLVFFLLVDDSRLPIVIDQPEENVDNETVYLRLVQIIKRAKIERQIIIVTHNPNLAVVCDAEQLICASRDKKNRDLVTYRTGGLESTLKDDALRVLEGTKPAFVTRQRKYGL
jgi:hypothetical protein